MLPSELVGNFLEELEHYLLQGLLSPIKECNNLETLLAIRLRTEYFRDYWG